MNNEALLIEILENLNPPKKKAPPNSWSLYYRNKGLTDVSMGLMIEHLQCLLDKLINSILDLEEEADDLSEFLLDDDFEIQIRSDIQHLFRCIMCFGETQQKVSAMECILSCWPFYLFPEFSDEISAATIMANGGLDEVLVEQFDVVLGNTDNAIVKANAISTALRQSSDYGRQKVLTVLQRFDEFHPEVVAVALMSAFDFQNLWTEKDKECIQHILASNYCSYLGINEKLVHYWSEKYDLELKPWRLTDWQQQRQWDFQSLVKSLRWFAVEGRWENHYFKYLGQYLSDKKPMLSFWQSILQREDAVSLAQYHRIFCEIIESKSKMVAENFASEIECSVQLLVNEGYFEGSRTELEIVLMNMNSFLSGIGDKYESSSFIKNLIKLENEMDQHLGRTYSSEKLVFGKESEEEAIKNNNYVDQVKSLWESEFTVFAKKCLEERNSKPSNEFNIGKVLKKMDIEIVG
ncbi:MAG: hypothetical protein ACXVCY_18975 [Pseudobdellovibrionaceae bacterium]